MKGIKVYFTYNCNIMCNSCKYKCGPHIKGIMPIETFKQEVFKAYNQGFSDFIQIEGGEPFLHIGTVFKYMKKINSLECKKYITTNGYWGYIDYYLDTLNDLKSLGLNEVIIEYDYFHSIFINKDIILNAIEKIKKAGLEVSIRSVVVSNSLKEDSDMITFQLLKDIKKEFGRIKINFELLYDNKNNWKDIEYKEIKFK
ncbi:hypothetical protein Q428_04980 [Fervidicella metallireducens AeB]|uniref:Radical SAM core domain-containing protein n=1 Tax=Fervidicella metallireducens AeB TaxID=1403537 RepID=A0A017RWT8_9CLOT|nr:radical SAM protein [Fervidicella metallireducens]EYE89026.1 hypothetical protein Q428_04980 [Fervidicella metallireducens AeB]